MITPNSSVAEPNRTPDTYWAAILTSFILLAGCSTPAEDTRIVRNITALAASPIAVGEIRNKSYTKKLDEAHQQANLLLAKYGAKDSAALAQDMDRLFELKQKICENKERLESYYDLTLPRVWNGIPMAPALLTTGTRLETESAALTEEFNAQQEQIVSKYGRR